MSGDSPMTEPDEESVFDAIDRAADVDAAIRVLRDLYNLGHVTYHHAQTVPADMNVDAPFVRTTYPAEWVSRYLVRGYVNHDPVVRDGLRRALPFIWSDLEETAGSRAVMADFLAHGLSDEGYSIPITDKAGRRALLSVNARFGETGWPQRVARHKKSWMEVSHAIHKKAIRELYGESDPAPGLSPREIETLYWISQGKEFREIAKIIGISDHTVRSYMRSARYKLDCATISQAVAKAIRLRLINP
ncbi:helix-turn-helix transcriptional regulator [Martelella alba]|nr:autoinducer binding domain-containing protein [Martelella alba]